MFKLMILPKTKPGLSRAGLRHYLEHVHGPLGMSLPAVTGGFLQYVHHYATDADDTVAGLTVLRGLDAVTTILFADEAAFRASIAAPDYATKLAPDEDNFAVRAESSVLHADPARTDIVVADDQVKQLHFRVVAAGLDRTVALMEWRARLDRIPQPHPAVRIVQNSLAFLAGKPVPYDSVDELWSTDASAMRAVQGELRAAAADLFAAEQGAAWVGRARIFRA